MALKGHREVWTTSIDFTLNDVTERGVVLTYKTSGSGVAIGDDAGAVQLSAGSSGTTPAGLLLNDFVNKDETVWFRNRYKDEMVIGEKCTLLKKGVVVTNKIVGTPSLGNVARLTSSGCLMTTNNGAINTPVVGQFLGSADEDGYVKVLIDLP